jgi:hypothetical protein
LVDSLIILRYNSSMIKHMTINEACDCIQDFAQANQVDELTGIEYMVRYYDQLSPRERTALGVFMAETGKKQPVDTKIIS